MVGTVPCLLAISSADLTVKHKEIIILVISCGQEGMLY